MGLPISSIRVVQISKEINSNLDKIVNNIENSIHLLLNNVILKLK